MSKASEYATVLDQAHDQAKLLLAAPNPLAAIDQYKHGVPLTHPLQTVEGENIVPLDKTVAQAIAIIVDNLSQNKYLYSILITCLIEKIVHPSQDIRRAQKTLDGGYANRTIDENHVTPFLKQHHLTHCATSGAESGRNFERPLPYSLNYQASPRGKGNLSAFLGILHAVEVDGIAPVPCLVLLMALDMLTQEHATYDYPHVRGLTIQDMTAVIETYFAKAQGHGRARLPVLVIYKTQQETGCEIVVNGLVSTLRYYLRLLGDSDRFLVAFTRLIESDPDVQAAHRSIWSAILSKLSVSIP